MRLILLILLVAILLGGVGGPIVHPAWQPGYGYGWGANGAIFTVLIIVVVLAALGFI